MSNTEAIPRSSEDPEVRRSEDNETSASRIWTNVEEAILIDSIKGYKAAPYKKKGEYVKEHVVKRIKDIDIKKHGAAAYENGGQMYDAWKLKKRRIFNYMLNYGATKRGVNLPGLNKKFTFVSVLIKLRRVDILEEAKRLAGTHQGKHWMKHYQQAQLNIQNALTKDEREVIEDCVKKWNKRNVPPAVQQKSAQKNGKKILSEMNRRNFISMGMRSLTMECHMAEDGAMRYSLTDTQSLKLDDPRIPSFQVFNPTAVAEMEDAYKLYVKEVLRLLKKHQLGNLPPEEEVEVIEEIGLTYHPGGLPKVPEEKLNKNGTETNRIQQGLIRDYINKHYELASGKTSKTQFMSIVSNPTRFIKPEFWPSGVEFKEPSKYSSPETNKILLFWRTKQKKNEIPFRFERVPIGNSVEPECYPDEIFNIMSSSLPPPPPPPPPIKRKKAKRITMRDYGDSDDSEEHNSELDDEQEFEIQRESEDEQEELHFPPGLSEESESEGDRPSDCLPLTPPDSDQSSGSSTLDGFSDSIPSSRPTKTRKQKKATKVKKAVPKAKTVVKNKAAVAKKTKVKTPPAPQHLTRAGQLDDAPPTQRTRSKTTTKQKGRK